MMIKLLDTKKINTRKIGILVILVMSIAGTTLAFADISSSKNDTTLSNPSIDTKPFKIPNVSLAFGIAISIVGFTTWAASYIIQKARRTSLSPEERADKKLYQGNFWDIIREGDYNPSLARFQFLLWTMAVSFTVVSVFFIRFFGAVPGFPSGDLIPANLLQMIGISTAVPVVSNVASRIQYASTFPKGMPPKSKVPKFSTMLFEGNKPTLARYQMFLWTWVSIIFFLVVFFSSVNDVMYQIDVANKDSQQKSNPLKNLAIQDIDSKLVLLMGLSQGGYIAAKFAARQPVQIATLVISNGNLVAIFGNNFGETPGMIKKGDSVIPVQPGDWHDSEINLTPPMPFSSNDFITVITSDGTAEIQKYDDDIII